MPSNPPVDFQQLAQGARGQSGSDYPYAIKATDLMKDFVFATLDIAEGVYEETTGMQGHRQRRLKIDAGTEANQIYIWNGDKITTIGAPPASGTHVLGAMGGTIQWIETEACE
jgi:hypothetical protein